jgi:multisubunit Na+/H+ antiporter MnhG subunit
VNVQTILTDILLGVAVLLVLASSLGVALMRDTYQKLHYVTPAALLAPLVVGVAVLVQSGFTANAVQTWLAVLFMVIGGPYLAHATIRAARIRATGDWRPPGWAGRRRPGQDWPGGGGPGGGRPPGPGAGPPARRPADGRDG